MSIAEQAARPARIVHVWVERRLGRQCETCGVVQLLDEYDDTACPDFGKRLYT